MKATKMILTLGMIALTSVTFSQFEGLAVKAGYNDNSRIGAIMYDIRTWTSEKFSRDVYEAPEVYMLIISERVDVVYEEEPGLESWMTSPFEAGLNEAEVGLESWMKAPFGSALVEEAVAVESWMKAPFGSALVEEAVAVESWMTRPFGDGIEEGEIVVESWMTAPFESAIAQINVDIESWMEVPFETADQLEVEDWMVSA